MTTKERLQRFINLYKDNNHVSWLNVNSNDLIDVLEAAVKELEEYENIKYAIVTMTKPQPGDPVISPQPYTVDNAFYSMDYCKNCPNNPKFQRQPIIGDWPCQWCEHSQLNMIIY